MTTSSNPQTTEAVPTASAEYKFGMRGAELAAVDPDRAVIVVAGEKASGKSHLFQSNPNAFIINCDHKTISYKEGGKPVSKATMFPMHINGKNYSAGREMKSFTWEDVRKCIDYLISIAGTDSAPKTVVIDTITAARTMVMQWLVTSYNKENFEQLGERGWVKINSEIAGTVDKLVAAGYGVQLPFHVRKTYIQDKGGDKRPVAPGDLANKVMIGIDCPAGQWTALQSKPSMVLGITRKPKAIREGKNTVQKMVTTLELGVNSGFDDCFGSMYTLPDSIELPEENTWEHFCNVFNELNN